MKAEWFEFSVVDPSSSLLLVLNLVLFVRRGAVSWPCGHFMRHIMRLMLGGVGVFSPVSDMGKFNTVQVDTHTMYQKNYMSTGIPCTCE